MARSQSFCQPDFENNHLRLVFKGLITKADLSAIYTDVRFGVADLQEEFSVISDFSECKLMYLNGLPTFRKIFQYILSKHSGEIVRVLNPQRLVSKQIINASLYRKGYKPIYAATIEEAEEKLTLGMKRDGLRFELNEQHVDIFHDDKSSNGSILNLSKSGCAITSSTLAPKKGDELKVKFTLCTNTSPEIFNLEGKVVRSESYSFAVIFNNLDVQKRNHLWRCLVEESDGEVR